MSVEQITNGPSKGGQNPPSPIGIRPSVPEGSGSVALPGNDAVGVLFTVGGKTVASLDALTDGDTFQLGINGKTIKITVEG